MHRLLTISCLTLVTLALAACGSNAASSAPDPAALVGTTWTVSSIGGVATVGGSQPTIRFDEAGNASGTTGCNQYTGTYESDGGSIRISHVSSTLMLCEGPVGAQETAFLAAFQSSSTWSVGSDGNLTLSGAGDIIASPA